MGQSKRQRTKDLVNSNMARVLLENALNAIEEYNFRNLVISGFIVKESLDIPIVVPGSPVEA